MTAEADTIGQPSRLTTLSQLRLPLTDHVEEKEFLTLEDVQQKFKSKPLGRQVRQTLASLFPGKIGEELSLRSLRAKIG
jgi:hypothetical protein